MSLSHESLDAANLRYILFLLDNKSKDHDGKVFCSLEECRRIAELYLKEGYSTHAVIGMFLMNAQAEEMLITMVETIGFTGDLKRVNQLQLFK